MEKKDRDAGGLIIMGCIFLCLPIVNPFDAPVHAWGAIISILFGMALIMMDVWSMWFHLSRNSNVVCVSRWQEEIRQDEVFLGYYTQETYNMMEIDGKRMGDTFNKKGKRPVFVKIPEE